MTSHFEKDQCVMTFPPTEMWFFLTFIYLFILYGRRQKDEGFKMHRKVKLKAYLTLLATNMKKATRTSLKLNVNFYNIMKFRICIKKNGEGTSWEHTENWGRHLEYLRKWRVLGRDVLPFLNEGKVKLFLILSYTIVYNSDDDDDDDNDNNNINNSSHGLYFSCQLITNFYLP